MTRQEEWLAALDRAFETCFNKISGLDEGIELFCLSTKYQDKITDPEELVPISNPETKLEFTKRQIARYIHENLVNGLKIQLEKTKAHELASKTAEFIEREIQVQNDVESIHNIKQGDIK